MEVSNIAQELRESAKATFYDPLKSDLNRAADCIEKLASALWRISIHPDPYLYSDEMAKIAREALGETCSD